MGPQKYPKNRVKEPPQSIIKVTVGDIKRGVSAICKLQDGGGGPVRGYTAAGFAGARSPFPKRPGPDAASSSDEPQSQNSTYPLHGSSRLKCDYLTDQRP
jgi:hypothetical protein